MASEIDDGGPAFPEIGCQDWNDEPGMSLRDFFASETLGGAADRIRGMKDLEERREVAEDIADAAYLIADSMIARKKRAN